MDASTPNQNPQLDVLANVDLAGRRAVVTGAGFGYRGRDGQVAGSFGLR